VKTLVADDLAAFFVCSFVVRGWTLENFKNLKFLRNILEYFFLILFLKKFHKNINLKNTRVSTPSVYFHTYFRAHFFSAHIFHFSVNKTMFQVMPFLLADIIGV
jgi:hypothetical protein